MEVYMKASEIRDRARSLSDLKNSQAITYEDEVRSLNESYKDIYNQLCNSDFDYNTKEEIITDWATYIDPNNPWAYNIPLPSDFYQLRFVDYNSNGNWYPMNRMNPNQRDSNSTEPLYRLKNTSIWMIIGPGNNMPSSIKISYYPVPDEITLPDNALSYNMDLTPSLASTTTTNWWISPITDSTLNTSAPDTMLYNYSNTLIAESQLNQTKYTLMSQNVSQIEYYKGFLYYLYAGEVYRTSFNANTNSTIIGTKIVFGGVSISSILTFNVVNDKLYASNASTAIEADTDGSNSVYFTGSPIPAYYPYIIDYNYQAYIDSTGSIIMRGPGIVDPGIPVIVGAYVNMASDGKKLFALDSVHRLWSIKFDYTDPLIPVATMELMDDDIRWIGGVSNGKLAIVRYNEVGNEAITAAVDFDLSYPSNTLYEIMSYQMAIDFKRKYEADTTELKERMSVMMSTFMNSMIKQDQYKVERIQNVRQIYSNYNWIR